MKLSEAELADPHASQTDVESNVCWISPYCSGALQVVTDLQNQSVALSDRLAAADAAVVQLRVENTKAMLQVGGKGRGLLG